MEGGERRAWMDSPFSHPNHIPQTIPFNCTQLERRFSLAGAGLCPCCGWVAFGRFCVPCH
jgi:hypothetical protein